MQRSLTNREYCIIDYLLGGLNNKDIANKLNISVRTVECHRQNIYKKLNITSTAELFKYAIAKDLIKNK